MIKVYIAHPMTNEGQDLGDLRVLIDHLRKDKCRVTQPTFSLLPDVLANAALERIAEADVIVADVSQYSHGVGFELGYAYALNKVIIIVADERRKQRVSKFITGIFCDIIYYTSGDDLAKQVAARITRRARNRDGRRPGTGHSSRAASLVVRKHHIQ